MEWFTKSRQKNTNQDCDVSISINKDGKTCITFNQAKTTCHVKVTSLDFIIGDYNLEFDKDQALYYIDSDRRLK